MNQTGAEGSMAVPPSPGNSLPTVARPHPVTEVTPAKKITFYKSGDPQFGGVKMAINRRSFKSFSALMDDLSNRVPLPFGVRTITTPRGTHAIKRLDQLQDGGRYICSDKKYVYPIAGGGPGRKASLHRPSRPMSARKQVQQEEVDEGHHASLSQPGPKQRKKITLVKNGDPNFRRPIVLNHRNVRSFKAFVEDVSDLLQYTVRKVYTVDGRRVDNIQGVLQAPPILVCVGREPFKPIQVENVRKSISEKLPGLRSHPSTTNEAMDNKKNANFGLKAKKSVIHPRSASSSRTRFSISSDKSYQNGLNMSPVNSGFASYTNECPRAKPDDATHSLINDDIEKKVHVNKDGSLSVEMKVRFRLLNEETLQWSTQIKKSSTLGKNKCEQLCLCDEDGLETKGEMNSEFYSETDDSFYPCDADSYSSKAYDPELKDTYCANCGMQCQDYDIWKNPMHSNQPEDDYVKRRTWQTRSSASSTTSQHNLTSNQKTSIDSLHTVSSEEVTEHIVHKSSRYSETRGNGATRVTYSAVSQCTSRSSQSVASSRAVTSENECTATAECPNDQCPGLKSSLALHHQCSEPFHGANKLKNQSGSFDGNTETFSRPCSNREDHCSQSVTFHPSPPVRECHRKIKMRHSRNAKSLHSSASCGEEVGQCTADTAAKIYKIKGISDERFQLEDSCSGHAEHPIVNGKTHSETVCNADDGELACDSSRADPFKFDNSSTRASSRTAKTSNCCKSLQKSRSGQSNRQGSCNSLGSTSFSKQSSEVLDDVGNGPREDQENLQQPVSPAQLNNKLENTKRRQTLKSNHSLQTLSSVTESTSSHGEDQPNHSNPEICDEPLENQLDCKSEDGMVSSPCSRSSSKSPCGSSKHNCVSCQENDRLYSMSSRVSTVSRQQSKQSESSDQHDCESTKTDTNGQTHQNMEPDCCKHDTNVSSKDSDSEFECTYSPSPPKGFPTNESQRLSKFKYSSGSVCSDQEKTAEKEEKTASSKSSTPGSKGIVASRASIETCKKLSRDVKGSSEEINTKKRKNSSTSSKLKLRGERAESGNAIQSELVPSALPNVSSEEVVHEWLRKIPSGTMAVDYEVEDCQTKVRKEIRTEVINGDPDEAQESKGSEAETEICHSIQNVGTGPATSITESHNAPESKKEVEENDDHAHNNKKGGSDLIHSIGHQKALPDNVHASVQIMKALLSPLQESKFDRCNSLPEVSPAKGRKLSNSAQVLISCLASLQLLHGSPAKDTEKSEEFQKPKCAELMNIFQALWADNSATRQAADSKPRKVFSQEDELTPVSSSGVDVNSGYGGSGDGSLIGGSECPAVAEKTEERSPANAAVDIKSSNHDTSVSQHPGRARQNSDTRECGINEGVSVYVDENMNEKKISDRGGSLAEDRSNCDAGHLRSDNDGIENPEVSTHSDDKLNNLSHTDKNPESNGSNSQETNRINSSSDCQSTVVTTSDSNGNSEANSGKPPRETDPVWVLKLLKKIEKEFMTHYVDAMNEFKVRWNLENNDNLDEMISELKNEVGQRIQKSIATELKKLQSRAGQKVPRPPNESSRRKSSLQAEERRKRLQTMRKRSALLLMNGDYRENGTIDISCETDEEDLTFSASFGDDINGQSNDDFCPCETCIKKKRILRLEKPKTPVADAPIIKAFDLQQILRMKKDNNDVLVDEITKTVAEELEKEVSDPGLENVGAGDDGMSSNEKDPLSNSQFGDQPHSAKSETSVDESEIDGHSEQSLKEDDNEGCTSNNLHSETEENQENADTPDENPDGEDELHEDTERPEKSSSSVSLREERMTVDCSPEHNAVDICEGNQQDCEEDDDGDFSEDDSDEHDTVSLGRDVEPKASSEDGDELHKGQGEGDTDAESYDLEKHNEECETTNTNAHENVGEEDAELLDGKDSCLHIPFEGQHSLITQNGSNEDADREYNGMKNDTGETSPNEESNSSGGKQRQMYPESSSEDEKADSQCGSPIGFNNNVASMKNMNKKGSFEDSESGFRRDLQEETIDQDDLDF